MAMCNYFCLTTYADAVFEGGGIKGIALLGAMRCCDDLGLRWQKLAGSSSGSLTAALLAANFAIDRLERELGGAICCSLR